MDSNIYKCSMAQYKKAKEMILELHTNVKRLISPNLKNRDFKKAGLSEVGVGSLDGVPVERVIIILRGSGCEWAQNREGGCTMCGHLSGSSLGASIPPGHFIKQFDDVMKRYDFRKYPMLCLYNGGSFLNEREIPKEVRRYMLRKIGAVSHIKRLIIESRPEHITKKMLDEIEALLPHTTVEIGVGVETVSDILRELVLNKGVTSAELIKVGEKFRNRKTRLLAYVLVNPPFLTEMEAIEDTVASIRFAAEIGAKIVSLEAVSIQHLTLVSFLAEAGFYQTPWIWSMFEIVRRTYHPGLQLRIGGFEFFPIPKEFTSNCLACNEKMIEKINEFNKYNDLGIIENLSCSQHCDLEWKKELQVVDNRNLPERIISTLGAIDIEKVLNRLKQYEHKN
ncbi:MAG: TIGR01210 family radical SAM protein [Candidatus Aminicenantes bacterium]|nr:TIGR01210 family radical SAM protein [Candidatus Aminicenantes bacterium]NIM83460.1 TIGR01210 family radical SAM protein [Candidatus Aminicenantes bacterium]NIN22852.1 TIGR01210 family radical SAM protein [Candidatus Aminicenantes bacterium]NIN46588.1 TIGR01210 family radical SAM protein [Candidatus Aminicenantes bacterium]NIN89491.1 TIGR01210 family radical SAM protein [Candidatus Aminicenantes bacterium]